VNPSACAESLSALSAIDLTCLPQRLITVVLLYELEDNVYTIWRNSTGMLAEFDSYFSI
jgi:hypothetical protein